MLIKIISKMNTKRIINRGRNNNGNNTTNTSMVERLE